MDLPQGELGENGAEEAGLGGLHGDTVPGAVVVGRGRGKGREGGGGAHVLGCSWLRLPHEWHGRRSHCMVDSKGRVGL